MGYFPALNKHDGRQLIPIAGRGYFITDSPSAEFVGANQREAFPLLPYSGIPLLLSGGRVYSFLIEAVGFIAIMPGAKYAFHEAEAYVRFDFNPAAVAQTSLFGFPSPVAPPGFQPLPVTGPPLPFVPSGFQL